MNERSMILREAFAALERGWALTPLRGKRPIFDYWPTLPRPTAADVQRWIAAGHNLGLRTGPVSGLVVIDYDPRHDDGTSLPEFPRTVTVRTGGDGLHRYFRCPPAPPPNSSGRLHPALDVKSTGGQVVFVGSVHPETRRTYVWETGLDPESIAVAHLPPDVLLRVLSERAARAEASPVARRALPADERIRRARAYLARVPGGISGEQGSRPCFRAACVLINGLGLTEEEAVTLLLTDYSPRCTPPWSEKEIVHKVKDAAKAGEARGFECVEAPVRLAAPAGLVALPKNGRRRIFLPRRVSRLTVRLLNEGRHPRYSTPDGLLDFSRAVYGAALSLLGAGMSPSTVADAVRHSALNAGLQQFGARASEWLDRQISRAQAFLSGSRGTR